MAPEQPDQTLLGHVGPVEVTLATTGEPWDLDVDTFLLSMGTAFGGLARAIAQRYPAAPWKSVDLLRLRPDAPEVIRLTPENERPRWAILGTVHRDPALQPTEPEVLAAIPVALRSALSVAARLGTRSLLVPLLGAGRLRVPESRVAAQIVSSLGVVTENLGPSRIVLLAQTPRDAGLIQNAWTTISRPPEPATSASETTDVSETLVSETTDLSDQPTPPDQRPDLSWLHPSALAALAHADALRDALGLPEVHMEHLLLGVDQDPSVHRRLEDGGLTRQALLDVVAHEAGLTRVPAVTAGTLDQLPPLSANAAEALRLARYLAEHDGDPSVDADRLLQGALSVDSRLVGAFLERAPGLISGEVEAELTGGVAADLVDPDQGIPLEKDDLGVSTYVTMMATAIARKDTKLPLSIGLFGEWGSGKSYFMGLLRGEVDKLSDEGGDAYHRGIVQIGFNAWSYADTNLWASLGDEIFRSLAGPPEDERNEREELRRRRERLQEWLAGEEGRLKELEAAKTAASGEVSKLKTELDRQRNDRRGSAKGLLKATVEAARADPAMGKALDDAWSKLGLTEEAQQAVVLADAVTGARDDLAAVRRSAFARPRYVLLAGAVLGLTLLAGALAASGLAARWLAGSGLVTLLAAAGTFALAIRRISEGARTVTGLADDIRHREQLGKDQKVAAALSAVRDAEAREQVLQAQLDEVVARIGELGRELIELSPGQRLYAFLAERAASDDYRGRLGLIATIRRDFERLARLQEQWRKHPTEDSPPPIDRIVLYIDDLDRCTPRQVVEVLQAVHLLLALDLFVVVVGVDPRWLLHSLRDQYRSLLVAPRGGSRTTDDAPNGADGAGRADEGLTELEADRMLLSTPQDYLEKIFNVPFMLPAMTPDGFDTMIRRLSEPEPDHEPDVAHDQVTRSPFPPETAQDQAGNAGAAVPAPRPATDAHGMAALVEEGSEVAAIHRGVTVVRTPLTEPELTVLSSLAPLVRSPREAKRLLNLYRMLRSTKNLSDASQFLDRDDEPGQFEAVAVLLGFLTANPRLLGQILFTAPDAETAVAGGICARDESMPWAQLLEGLRPRLDGDHWRNDVSACLTESERVEWEVLLDRAKVTTEAVRLPDLKAFKEWAPHVARFSFVLTPAARAATR